jgi:hypothetical protein
VNVIFIPLINILPAGPTRSLKKIHKSCEEMIEYAGTYRAMEIIYDVNPRPKANWFQNYFLSIWLGINNSKAVRNRLKLVKREIKKKIIQLALDNKDIKIINVASGSARAVLESVDDIHLDNNHKLSAVFIDKNNEALLFSQKLASTNKHYLSFQWVNDTAENFFKLNDHKADFNIAEVVGLLEYLSDNDVLRIFSLIHESLDSDGILITTNTMKNSERRFFSDVIGWKMIYRSADELSSLLMDAGFSLDMMKIYYEPQRIHCIIVAKK